MLSWPKHLSRFVALTLKLARRERCFGQLSMTFLLVLFVSRLLCLAYFALYIFS